MSELINRINCPNGCKNPIFTESVKIISENKSNLLMESQAHTSQQKKVKVYNCNCCGQTFELHENQKDRLIL